MSETKTRSGATIAIVMDESNNSIVFNVAGAAPEGGSKSITFHADKGSDACRRYAELLGWKNRLGDSAAKSRDAKTGLPVPASEKFDSIRELIEHYESGATEWNLRTATGERTDGELAMLLRAICEIKPNSAPEKVREWLKSKSKAERAALGLRPDIKALVDGYRAEQAAPVDADAMLDELA